MMKARFMELLARHAAADHQALGEMIQKMDAASAEVATLLASLDPSLRQAVMEMFIEEVTSRLTAPHRSNGVPDGKLPPELLEWGRQSVHEEEFMAGVREIRETGGLKFDDFVEELERAARKHDQ